MRYIIGFQVFCALLPFLALAETLPAKPESISKNTIASMKKALDRQGVFFRSFALKKDYYHEVDQFIAIFGGGAKFMGETFPEKSSVSYFKCAMSDKPVMYFLPSEQPLPFRGARCKQISVRSETAVECKLNDKFSFRGADIPAGTEVLFKLKPEPNDTISVNYIMGLTKNIKIEGKEFKKGLNIKVEGSILRENFIDNGELVFRCSAEKDMGLCDEHGKCK